MDVGKRCRASNAENAATIIVVIEINLKIILLLSIKNAVVDLTGGMLRLSRRFIEE
jgi:hypothetical protein